MICSLIVASKMNDVDPQAWLADVLARVAGHRFSRLHEAPVVALVTPGRGK
jgi:hypothetical protein